MLWPTFCVAFALGYLAYALPWLVFQARKLGKPPAVKNRLQDSCNRFGQFVLEPSDQILLALYDSRAIALQPDDVLFCPAYWHDQPPEHFQNLRQQIGHIAVLIHDVIPASHPAYYKSPWRESFRDHAEQALTGFDSVFTISHYTAAMLRQLFPAAAAKAKIAVCHNGLEPLPLPAAAPDCAGAFDPALPPFLMVGTIEPKKGHVQVLRALERLWDQGAITRKLVIIGGTGWMYEDIVTALTQSHHADKVIWLKNADDAALAYAYRHAHALIHASVVEGFGLPMIEAAAAGLPVLARKTDIATEVMQNFGHYYDGEDAGDLARALIELESPDTQRALRERLASFYWPEWRDVVMAFFAALLDRVQNQTPLPAEIVPPRP